VHTGDQLAEGWFLLARSLEKVNRQFDAEEAFKQSVAQGGRFAYRSRFRLAEIELARGNTDRAVDMLEMNLKQLRLDPDDEAMDKSLFLLGHLLAQRRDHAAARPILEEGVSRFPSSPACVRGRFELAETYLRLAAQENQHVVLGGNLPAETREHFLKQYRLWLGKAAEQYELLGKALTADPRAATVLTQAEQVHVLFSVADCRFNLGDYPQALRLYSDLAERYKGRQERLSALGGTARCFAAQRDFVKFHNRLKDIQVALQGADPQTRREWEQWLSVAGRGKPAQERDRQPPESGGAKALTPPSPFTSDNP
jgi:tetratricopeptide (TPR) repeat protein